jgi:hypothetical protein
MRHHPAASLMLVVLVAAGCGRRGSVPAVYIAKDASPLETFAVAELRRYLYVTTGRLASVRTIGSLKDLGSSGILLDASGRWPEASAPELRADDYVLKTFKPGRISYVVIAGRGPALLYGTYAFVEKLGVRFYLDGDVIPEDIISFDLPVLDERGRPLFKWRGIQPFHDFAEGPDWWGEDAYKAVLGQLPKLRMNFFGLHTYPEKAPNAEPTVWIGRPGEFQDDGNVTASYPSSYQNTKRANPGSHNWGFQPKKTSDFHFGAGEAFETDDYGASVMAGLLPEPASDEASNELFNRTGALLRGAFSFGRKLGVRTCVGTETPLTIPAAVQVRLKAAGMDPKDPRVVKDLYRGIFARVAKAYPVDFYWFWTDEGWTWSDASPEAINAVTTDLAMAVAAAAEIRAPFDLATCGWVLGPPSRRSLFDEVLPKTVAASCINREVGKAPVDPGFAGIAGRSKWAIPWLEDDPSLTSPQLWAGRMRRDAADALKYGCDGLMGIHWRTRILGPNVLALAWAAWDQGWNNQPTDFAGLVGPVNGRYAVVEGKTISGTANEAVYRDSRDRVYGYRLLVPDGVYSVTLQFCEGEFDRPKARVFDISIQGRKVADGVDIFARAGRWNAFDLVFRNVTVQGGRMRVDFADRIHYPSIAGLVVEGRTAAGEPFVKKVNCGGPKAGDYDADWPETPRFAETREFYADWAKNQFGRAAAREIAEIFARVDGKLPIPVTWTNGPGGIRPDARPWDNVRKEFGFVDELAGLRPRLTGIGYRERFDYWLRNFEGMREIAHFQCLWAEFNQALEKARPEASPEAKTAVLAARVKMVESLRAIFRGLLATAGTMGELGTIANWEQHNLPEAIEKPGEALKKILGIERLPVEAELPRSYEGPPRIIVPVVRPSLGAGESLALKVIILDASPPEHASLHWRALGKGKFKAVPLRRLARSVYQADLPAPGEDFEYYISARVREGDIVFPTTAPKLNQTVVIMPN